jgi:hypothetical protein
MDEKKKITENKPDVPYIVYEGEMARAERYIKRLWIALIVVTAAFAVSVLGFFWYLSLYDFSAYEYTQDGEGVNIVGDENGVDYNGTESNNPAENTKGWQSNGQSNP